MQTSLSTYWQNAIRSALWDAHNFSPSDTNTHRIRFQRKYTRNMLFSVYTSNHVIQMRGRHGRT